MKHLPYSITTAMGQKYRTSHGLTSCRRAYVIDCYDRQGNQHIVLTSRIRSHSSGSLTHPARNKPEPKEPERCGYCREPYEAVHYGTGWPQCGYCGGV
ncbi:hypothetical protein [Spirosoma sordidisoli]|uniref:Uncharacterized protein n=1 Tax=Spirosoma sordidisoli TaxID=2502893 RepID=A0A4Q2UKR6_9BACT|nr:hypothetical protein [Spirosoma sordidisoli]RYC70083.1 hypothetical protein EQG79_09435 [Spirosoma sordidisoli]